MEKIKIKGYIVFQISYFRKSVVKKLRVHCDDDDDDYNNVDDDDDDDDDNDNDVSSKPKAD